MTLLAWAGTGAGCFFLKCWSQAGIYWPSLLGVQAHRGMSSQEDGGGLEEGWGGGVKLVVVRSNLQPHTYCVLLYACRCAERPQVQTADKNRHLCLHPPPLHFFSTCYHRGLQKKTSSWECYLIKTQLHLKRDIFHKKSSTFVWLKEGLLTHKRRKGAIFYKRFLFLIAIYWDHNSFWTTSFVCQIHVCVPFVYPYTHTQMVRMPLTMHACVSARRG